MNYSEYLQNYGEKDLETMSEKDWKDLFLLFTQNSKLADLVVEMSMLESKIFYNKNKAPRMARWCDQQLLELKK